MKGRVLPTPQVGLPLGQMRDCGVPRLAKSTSKSGGSGTKPTSAIALERWSRLIAWRLSSSATAPHPIPQPTQTISSCCPATYGLRKNVSLWLYFAFERASTGSAGSNHSGSCACAYFR
eukprot:6027813-Prymnesium_polylepis.2